MGLGDPNYFGLSDWLQHTPRERGFSAYMETNPNVRGWRQQARRHGWEPQIEGSDYDYRGAWEAGIQPEENPYHILPSGETAFHWGSIGVGRKDLKSKDHKTRWKSDYMKITGTDPDEDGVSEKDAKRLIAAYKKARRY